MREKKKPVESAIEEYEALISQLAPPMGPLNPAIPRWVRSLGGSYQGVPELSSQPKPPSVDAIKLASLKTAEPYKVTALIPDYVHVITAWRAWAAKPTSDGWRLEALGKSVIWEPKKAIEAKCVQSLPTLQSVFPGRQETSPRHLAPQSACNCGVWAFKELDNLVAAIGSDYKEVKVLGQVSLWGRIIETENGYRAEKAYPSELWIFSRELEELGLIYDVPVRCVD